MKISVTDVTAQEITCSNCKASCCQLEVLLITETGVPEHYIARDAFGGESMLRLDDGWCAALNRETFLCRIYDNRPWICREFEMGGVDCQKTRAEDVGQNLT